ncbi:N-acetylneuraminate synthase family protein [Gammaproteobacteria bacterium]|nr:N-acetylneuraminate synthase family protein [Gammaproteobacteria bacterium]
MQISDYNLGGKNVFVIAEIGNNHNGSVELALEMVDAAREAGANCVKFQMRNMSAVYRKKSLAKQGEDLGTEYVLDLLERFQLSQDEHKQVAKYCEDKGILYMCTPWDSDSIIALEALDVQAYKVASADLTNLPLIEKLVATKKPLILSTGMSSVEEIQITTSFLNSRHAEFVLLHCNSTYPAPFHDINLNWINKLKDIHPLVGYSGHERGIAVTLAAVGLGAKVVERHFTFDRSMEGPDHAASLEAGEFKALVAGIREIEEALGDGVERAISQGEMINRENLSKSLVASIDLVKGTIIKPQHLKVLSPGQGLSAQNYEHLLGRTVQRDMLEEDYFYPSDLQDTRVEPKSYKFNRPWGVPVRYHDFGEYNSKISPDCFEFHLSYSDLDLNIDEFLKGEYNCGFVVHAPELFSGSRLMDLASPDEEYRQYSLRETQRVIDITRSLKKHFPATKRPMIVANIGGFTMDALLPTHQLVSYYERFAVSLSLLDMDGVELIPQTMAPFPWHFGGQRYQNLFVHADECRYWCEKLDLRMCFDISHSRLMSNHFGVDFYEFAEKIAPITGHLHLGDASGVNGEGLQIGEGDIDFDRLAVILDKHCPEASFIPEIWQGHKNAGEGFWIALERLETTIGGS